MLSKIPAMLPAAIERAISAMAVNAKKKRPIREMIMITMTTMPKHSLWGLPAFQALTTMYTAIR